MQATCWHNVILVSKPKLVKTTSELLVWEYQEYYEHSALTSRGLVSGTVEIIDSQSRRASACKRCQEMTKSVDFVSECQNKMHRL